MGNCTEKDGKQRNHYGPVKPEPRKLKVRCIETVNGPTKAEFTIDDIDAEKASKVYDIIKQQNSLAQYKLMTKDLAAFYDEENDNELVMVDDDSELYQNKVYSILIYKAHMKKFKFRKNKANSKKRKAVQLTSSGVITEEDYEDEDDEIGETDDSETSESQSQI